MMKIGHNSSTVSVTGKAKKKNKEKKKTKKKKTLSDNIRSL